ncbi:hypothetical protein MSIM_03550 [Mycobacterium simiae]|nr:hypothetical protein MSIM_03550 [Mycobacterium simiae]
MAIRMRRGRAENRSRHGRDQGKRSRRDGERPISQVRHHVRHIENATGFVTHGSGVHRVIRTPLPGSGMKQA